jgi:hypothetical protein
MDTRLPLREQFKSRFPAANVRRLNETVATDTFFFDIAALDDGIMVMVELLCSNYIGVVKASSWLSIL